MAETPRRNLVMIVLGSPADLPWAERILESLGRYGVSGEMTTASAHKTPAYLLDLLSNWEGHDHVAVYITIAGRSNALSGFVDAQVSVPVIACPPASDAFGGMDLLSSLRMPRGVAPLVVLEPENAALAAAKIVGLGDSSIHDRLVAAQEEERQRVIGANQ